MPWGCLMGWDGVNPFAKPFFTGVYKRSSGLGLVANRCRNEGLYVSTRKNTALLVAGPVRCSAEQLPTTAG